MNKNPLWYKLIKLLKQNGNITTGLTVPYIFGAYELHGQAFSSTEEMLNHILENPIDKYPVIQKCHVIQQHVLMVERKEICNKSYLKDIHIENSKKENKLFISTNTDLGKSFDKVSLNLSRTYLSPIERKHYSWDNKAKVWQKFSSLEIETIMSIKNNNQ
ncbi:hypothetical protein [Flavobacterium sp.]|uniref:hypothetical protein n=1 Tax=Flavobacterium sp. TaxID=239 RepID=UPI004034EF54